MTDEHGSESQPAHEDIPADEHHAPETEAGAWSDDHPPVDDFADPGSVSEDAATSSQEAAAETDEPMATGASNSSRSMLPLFAGIGGVLLIAAVVYWQFGHSSSPLPPPVAMQASTPKPTSSVSSRSDFKPATASAASATTTGEADIASLYKVPPEPTSSPIPEAASPSPAALPPSPPSTPSSATAATIVAPPAPASPVAPAAAPVDTRIDALSTRLESLQKSLDDAAHRLDQLSNMVAANQAMPPVSNQTTVALEDRLNKVEQNLMQVEHNEAAAKAQPVLAPMEATEMPAKTVIKAASHYRKPSTKHKVVHKKIKSHRYESMPRETISAPSPWVLRAATPSEAWVASDATSAELRHVQVGDSLSGVGQVRAIRKTMSGWEIDGTSGTVR